MKEKYPDIEILLPTPNWLKHVFGTYGDRWNFGKNKAIDNVDLIFANNPYVTGRFDIGEFDFVYNDHMRTFRYDNEPLVEKLIRAFGFTEQEISNADTRPELYFSDEEKEIGDSIIEKYVGHDVFGCLLLSARAESYQSEWGPERDGVLIEEMTDKYRTYPVFYYSLFDVTQSRWGKVFKEYINFEDIPEATLRIQMYIKSKALFNTGYQAGINDCIGGGIDKKTQHYLASPYKSIGDNAIRHSFTYYFPDGSKTSYSKLYNT